MANTIFKRKDYYQLLEVKQSSNIEEIKANFKKLKKKHHPDKFLDQTEKLKNNEIFLLLTEAYNVLSDKNERTRYDLFLKQDSFYSNHKNYTTTTVSEPHYKNGTKPQFNSKAEQDQHIVSELLKYDTFDFFDTTAEGVFKQNIYPYTKNQKPTPYIHKINLSTQEMDNGSVHILKYKISRICRTCQGNVQSICRNCHNSRVEYIDKEIFLRFPSNTQFNEQFTIKNKGYSRADRKGIGDLNIIIEHFDIKWKKEKDFYVSKELISKSLAKTGGVLEINYLNNQKLRVNIPKNIKHNTRLRLKEKGFKDKQGKTTDLILEMKIKYRFLSMDLISKLSKATIFLTAIFFSGQLF